MMHSILNKLSGKKNIKSSTNAFRSTEDIIKDLELISELMEKKILTPVIDRIYPMDEIVKAHKYVESGKKQGNVILEIIKEQ